MRITTDGSTRAALGRGAILRSLIVVPLGALPHTALIQPARALIGQPTAPTIKYQSDDKSFDFLLPESWTLSPESGRTGEGSFRVSAHRKDTAATLQLTVDKGKYGKQLAAFGTPQSAVAKVLLSGSGSDKVAIESATQKGGRVKGSVYYLGTYRREQTRGILKIGVQQDRLYQLRVESKIKNHVDRGNLEGEIEREIEREIEGIVDSFQVFPVNFICLGISNKGQVPAPGTCY